MDVFVLQAILAVGVFLLGLCIGSFLNVVVYRYQTGAPIGNDRSRCMSCGKTLSPWMLIPLISFILQRGRCAYCQTKLSLQYPIVEFLSGTLALATFLKSGLLHLDVSWSAAFSFASAFLFFSILLAITAYDWKHKIIPDRFSFLLFLSAILAASISITQEERTILSSIVASVLAASPFALLWLFSRGKWMGLGDAKLALGLGFFLGYPVAASVPVLAFWAGTIPALLLLLFRRGITMKSEIPFGPFLALATFILYVYPIDIIQLTTIWPNFLR
jgi:leader peptidase (prepilin peptidase) / N-methyltransferase